jgi:hypothetical protein
METTPKIDWASKFEKTFLFPITCLEAPKSTMVLKVGRTFYPLKALCIPS